MPPRTDYEAVTSHLNSLKINYSEDWVLKCINHVKSSRPFLSSNDLCNAVYQEWLLVNLRELKVPSLPSNLLSREKVTLTGTYAVQVESMVDISKSSYSELRKLQEGNKVVENTEESVEEGIKMDQGGSRCLLFVLCDGVQEIQGMEYQQIPSFSLNDPGILPGIKVLIVGPVICRKGMLLLKKENVKIYGGKVESLCETNNFKSLLCKRLGLNSDSEEYISNQSAASEVNVNTNQHNLNPPNINNVAGSSFSRSEYSNVIGNDGYDEFLSDYDDILASLTVDSDNFNNECNDSSSKEIISNSDADVDGCVLFHESENQVSTPNPTSSICKRNYRKEEVLDIGKSKKAKLNENISFESDIYGENLAFKNDSTSENLVIQSVLSSPEGILVESSKRDMEGRNYQMKIPSTLSGTRKNNSQFGNSSEKVRKQVPLFVSSYPFIYLKQTVDVILSEPVTFTVKAIILTLKSKISMKDDKFALKAVISDGSYAIQVDFSSEILENIIEYSPCEITSFISEKKNNSAISEKLKSIFSSAQQKLLSMNCLMKIKFFTNGSLPIIIGLEEIQLQHVNALKARMLKT